MEEILDIIQERWKPIINYEGLYEISNYGIVKSLNYNRTGKEQILKLGKDKDNYSFIILCKNGKERYFKIHRLVLETFVGPCPPGMQGCHNDGNPSNNFTGNLRWDTSKNNHKDQVLHGTDNSGFRNPNVKLNDLKLRVIRRLLEDDYLTQREIAKLFHISYGHISRIKAGQSWRE